MIIKILKIKRKFASIIIVSLIIITTFTTVNSSSLISLSNVKNSKMDKKISIDNYNAEHFKKESNNEDKSFTEFLIVINFIKLILKDNPEIVSLCQHAYEILQILPYYICRILYWFVFFPIIQILNNIWYNHPDYMIQYYAFLLLEFVFNIYYFICDWIPPPIDNLKSIYGISSLSNLISSSDISPCPCKQG